ncbi:MAG: hypothetical protein V3W43_02555 [Desulfatiglandaceae bacterium]
MSGLMEVLLIVAIALGILMLPRLTARKPEGDLQLPDHGFRITGWIRVAIVASLLWLALIAFLLKPWDSHWLAFLYVGVGPVALIWAICWVFSGFRKKRK